MNVGGETGGRHAHGYGCLGHALECVAAGFGWWAFGDEVAEDGGCCEDCEVYFVHGLRYVSRKSGVT